MIAYLHGRLAALEDSAIVVDVGGVGYRVHVPAPLLADLGPLGAPVTVHTYLHVRETEMELYGAGDADSLGLFRLLLTVSGVGPRLALAMLSTYDAPRLQRAIVAEDVETLVEVPGVGRKTAQRLVLDLKSRLEAAGVVPEPAGTFGSPEDADALAALMALGYGRGEARRALAAAPLEPAAPVEERIRAALQALAER
jgi:Holliday junction DNA helicase RuvA